MLIFPSIKKLELNKKHHILLEEILRHLGKFNNQDIIINAYEILKNGDVLLSTKDIDETTFKFYNFDVDDDMKLMTRFRKSYYIIMKRKNSNIEYTYDFFYYNDKTENKRLNLIEISVFLAKKRKITFKLTEAFSNEFIIEENKKRYFFHYSEDINFELIEKLERLIDNIKNIENMNIENILRVIPPLNKLKQCMVYEKDKRIAAICFDNGNIIGYEINDNLEIIKVNVDGIITRSIIYNDKVIEKKQVSHENKTFKNECKRLFKEI